VITAAVSRSESPPRAGWLFREPVARRRGRLLTIRLLLGDLVDADQAMLLLVERPIVSVQPSRQDASNSSARRRSGFRRG
jgi:hypothetical protein